MKTCHWAVSPAQGVHQALDLRKRDGAERKRGRDGETETERGKSGKRPRQGEEERCRDRHRYRARARLRGGEGGGDHDRARAREREDLLPPQLSGPRTHSLTTAIGASSPLQTWISGAEF